MKFEVEAERNLHVVRRWTVEAESVCDAVLAVSMDILRGQVATIKLDGAEVGGVDYDSCGEPMGWVEEDE